MPFCPFVADRMLMTFDLVGIHTHTKDEFGFARVAQEARTRSNARVCHVGLFRLSSVRDVDHWFSSRRPLCRAFFLFLLVVHACRLILLVPILAKDSQHWEPIRDRFPLDRIRLFLRDRSPRSFSSHRPRQVFSFPLFFFSQTERDKKGPRTDPRLVETNIIQGTQTVELYSRRSRPKANSKCRTLAKTESWSVFLRRFTLRSVHLLLR